MVGMDLARANIGGRPPAHQAPRASFVLGNAVALPFAGARFDVVVSVESSHGYRPFAAFAAEVHRVLKPGGACLLGDLRVSGEWPAVRRELSAAGLEPGEEHDLSAGVLRGIDGNEARQRLLLERLDPAERARRAEIMLHRGSAAYTRFERGESRFLALTLRKPLR
jgi:SAM-dependent methyltransferase